MAHPLISAIRLRTLPLAAGAIFMGAGVAMRLDSFDALLFSLILLTAFLLQILSNLANDYGDFMNGADAHGRADRALSSGAISPEKMKTYLIVNCALALASGIALLTYASSLHAISFIGMLLLGIFCILAALFYTMGKRPYGYAGWGDISVGLFFGPVAVAGSAYLFTGEWQNSSLVPFAVFGMLAVAVLNVNNLRDIVTDKESNKITVAVRLGFSKAKIYQYTLVVLSLLSLVIGEAIYADNWKVFLFILPIFLYFVHCKSIHKLEQNDRLGFNKQLKNLSLTNLLFALLFFINSF
jgi:1,4-dihydroxy-2-naphthoate polyprenyltransferase